MDIIGLMVLLLVWFLGWPFEDHMGQNLKFLFGIPPYGSFSPRLWTFTGTRFVRLLIRPGLANRVASFVPRGEDSVCLGPKHRGVDRKHFEYLEVSRKWTNSNRN